jgi:hypothetical protein
MADALLSTHWHDVSNPKTKTALHRALQAANSSSKGGGGVTPTAGGGGCRGAERREEQGIVGGMREESGGGEVENGGERVDGKEGGEGRRGGGQRDQLQQFYGETGLVEWLRDCSLSTACAHVPCTAGMQCYAGVCSTLRPLTVVAEGLV